MPFNLANYQNQNNGQATKADLSVEDAISGEVMLLQGIKTWLAVAIERWNSQSLFCFFTML